MCPIPRHLDVIDMKSGLGFSRRWGMEFGLFMFCLFLTYPRSLKVIFNTFICFWISQSIFILRYKTIVFISPETPH